MVERIWKTLIQYLYQRCWTVMWFGERTCSKSFKCFMLCNFVCLYQIIWMHIFPGSGRRFKGRVVGKLWEAVSIFVDTKMGVWCMAFKTSYESTIFMDLFISFIETLFNILQSVDKLLRFCDHSSHFEKGLHQWPKVQLGISFIS